MRVKQKKPKTNRARLQVVQKMLAEAPEGRKLLALARRRRVPISFSAEPKKMDALGLFDIEGQTVTLNPAEKDKTLSGVLAHELRHLWQSGIARVKENKLYAVDMLVRRRLIEGDAVAFEKRFLLSPQMEEIEKLAKVAARYRKRPDARPVMKILNQVRAQFGMKAGFMEAQKKRMGAYDKQTLHVLSLQLKMTQIYAEEKRFLDAHPSKSALATKERRKCSHELKKIFNRVSAPQPLDESLVNITRDGLSPGSPNYLGCTTMKQLAALIRKQVPAKTLKKARALEEKIRKTAEKAVRPR